MSDRVGTATLPVEGDRVPGPDMQWIPGATFRMGSDDHYPEEAPAHPVAVDGFWIDRYTVTNRDAARRTLPAFDAPAGVLVIEDE